MRPTLLLAMGLLALACAPHASPGSGAAAPYVHELPGAAASPQERECLARPQVEQALRSLHTKVAAAWRVPPGIPANQRVVLAFRWLPSGHVYDVEVTEATDDGLRASILTAFARSGPFRELTDDSGCLADFRLRATFSNPEGTGRAAPTTAP